MTGVGGLLVAQAVLAVAVGVIGSVALARAGVMALAVWAGASAIWLGVELRRELTEGRRWRRMFRDEPAGDVRDQFLAIAASMGVPRAELVCGPGDMAKTTGFGSVVLVGSEWLVASADVRGAVMAHELAHTRQRWRRVSWVGWVVTAVSSWGAAGTAVGVTVAGGGSVQLLGWAAVVLAVSAVGLAVWRGVLRRCELDADVRAAVYGHAPALMDTLDARVWSDATADGSAGRGLRRRWRMVWDTHPCPDRRRRALAAWG